MDKGILLESGTNELEILEFKVGNNHYGINVAKINEILPYQKPTLVPNAHPSIEGIFMPRDTVISIIDLAKSLNLPDSSDKSSDKYIVTNFNNLHTGFHVHEVVAIHRVSWKEILKPDSTISSQGNGVATGIIKLDGKLIIIVVMEKIVSDINPETGLKVSDIDQLGMRKRNEAPILIAEDSPLLNALMLECLHKAGYTNVTVTNNGQEAWDKLNQYKDSDIIKNNVSCIITDIEMPQMDGHRLTKLVKSDDELKEIPVIIFSSLINDDMKRKGELLGADAQLTKPEIGDLVQEIDKLVL